MGRYNESNYPVQEFGRKRGGGHIFEGRVLAGHCGIVTINLEVVTTLLVPVVQLVGQAHCSECCLTSCTPWIL